MQIESRLDLIHAITRKYGGNVDDVLLYFAKITEEYNSTLTGNNLSFGRYGSRTQAFRS